jgi:pimeloyl-ACP methyl ester carboxylesterase
MGIPGGQAPGKTRGITGLVYRSVNGITQLVGLGLGTLLRQLEFLGDAPAETHIEAPRRQAFIAALNGVLGDRLASDNNPLATPLNLRYQGKALDWQALTPMPEATDKVLLLIHGLCMNDLQWQEQPRTDGGHGEALAAALGYTPVYLRYNSGLPVSRNALELSTQLEQLATSWPIPIKKLSVIGHSMGGLLARSAVCHAYENNSSWPDLLKNIVFLGTPHHGAPLERAGAWLEAILGSSPYTAPFTALGRLRSAGITDLRYGACGLDLPLPESVSCYTIAATTSDSCGTRAGRFASDGLVPLNSALGVHSKPHRTLEFAPGQQWISYRTNHIELLNSPAVTQQILHWFGSE